jgi:hypothetical protein
MPNEKAGRSLPLELLKIYLDTTAFTRALRRDL